MSSDALEMVESDYLISQAPGTTNLPLNRPKPRARLDLHMRKFIWSDLGSPGSSLDGDMAFAKIASPILLVKSDSGTETARSIHG